MAGLTVDNPPDPLAWTQIESSRARPINPKIWLLEFTESPEGEGVYGNSVVASPLGEVREIFR